MKSFRAEASADPTTQIAQAARLAAVLRVVLVSLAVAGPAFAQKATGEANAPRLDVSLMLDTGGHTSKIQAITFTRDGKSIVSASDDKSVRIWDWSSGKTARFVRGQIGPGDEGKIYAMALSRDERLLATAGYLGSYTGKKRREDEGAHKIRIHDFATGEVIAVLSGHTNVVNSLAFSPDGKRLVSSGGDNTAILWDVGAKRIVSQLKGHKEQVYGAAFSPDGARVVTASDDATLRLWQADSGRLIAELKGHKKDLGRAVAIRQRDGLIASGDATGEIRLWDGNTGQFVKSWQAPSEGIGALAFSPDGETLLGSSGRVEGKDLAVAWNVASGAEISRYTKHDNIILAVAISPDGRLAASGGGTVKAVHVWDLATGETKQILGGTGQAVWAVGFSPDGQRLGWGQKWASAQGKDSHISEATSPIQFQLALPTSEQRMGRPEALKEAGASSFLRAKTSRGDYSLTRRKGGPYGYDAILDLKKNGTTVASLERNSTNGYQHRAYGFSPDGQTFVSSGANGFLQAFDVNGRVLGEFVGHDTDIWAVTPSADGRLLASGSADQTVRLWNLKSRELVATLYYGRDGEWVIWIPHGYYTGSPGAGKILGWQVNNGFERSAKYVQADEIKQHLNRPDIVERAILLASANAAIRDAPGTRTLGDLLAAAR